MLDKNTAIEVYSADINVFDDEDLYKDVCALVSPERIARTAGFYRDTDKKLSVLSEALLFYALRHNGYDKAVELGKGEHGKPYIKNGKFNFNISHSGSRAACAVTLSETEIGCDIEAVTQYDSRIAKRIFDEKEQALLASASEEKADILFTELWTKKESYVKCTGMGMTSISSRIKDGYGFYGFNGFEGYSLTVCVNTTEEVVPNYIEVTQAMLRGII